MDVFEVDDALLELDARVDSELQWLGASEDTVSSLSQHSLGFQAEPCRFFDVLGTQDTWQGKRFNMFMSHSGPRGMLQLVKWPVVNILNNLLDSGSVWHLCMVAMSCRCMRDVALAIIEEHSQEQLKRKFYDGRQLFRFVDSFAFFSWAYGLRSWMPAASLKKWQPRELDAAYDCLVARIVVDETSPFVGLTPYAAMRWKVEGRRAFELFCTDCLGSTVAYRKLLYHYNKAWVQVYKILEENATAIRRSEFKGHSTTHRIDFAFPNVTIHVHCPISSDSGTMHWTIQDVYHWFRLKKFPVAGLLDMQLDGPALVRLCQISEFLPNADNLFLRRWPQGLGMSAKQFTRLLWFMKTRCMTNDEPSKVHQITFQVGEQKSG